MKHDIRVAHFRSLMLGVLWTCGIALGEEDGQQIPHRRETDKMKKAADTTSVQSVTLYPGPKGEKSSPLYTVRVNGLPVFVYECRVHAKHGTNKGWPQGDEPPPDQTELTGFAYWDMSGPVQVEVTSQRAVKDAVVRPLSYGIRPEVRTNTIAFRLERPMQVVVEVNGLHHALHLFANPPEKDPPGKDAPGVRYFGPGVHDVGFIEPKNGETIYIAGGAVVYGRVKAIGVRGIVVRGRGILDASRVNKWKPDGKPDGNAWPGMFHFQGCTNVTTDGIVLRDSNSWAVQCFNCEKVNLSWLKLIGFWRYNSDGICFSQCRDASATDCFIRSYDDSFTIKGMDKALSKECSTRSNRAERVVVWTDWGKSFGVMYETPAESFANILFKDCDVIHSMACGPALTVSPDNPTVIDDVVFEDIRVEDAHSGFIGVQAKGSKIGTVRFKNVSLTGGPAQPSQINGGEKVVFENLQTHGKVIRDAAAGGISVGSDVKSVRFLAE